jgi:hypothetical protein
MNLKATIQATGSYTGKSKFQFFADILVGDILVVQYPLNQTGGYRVGRVAYANIRNTRTTEVFEASIQNISSYLDKIPYVEI